MKEVTCDNDIIINIKQKLLQIGFTDISVPKGLRRFSQFKKYFSDEELEFIQSFLDKYESKKRKITFFTLFYLIMNDKLNDFIRGDIKCVICGDGNVKYINYSDGFSKTCSKKCSDEYKKRAFDRALKVYCEKNNISYDVDNISQIKEIKQKRKEWFASDEFKVKMRQTNLKKYGVENPFQAKEIKEKIRQTNLEKYGAENPMKSDLIKKKSLNTIRKNKLEKRLLLAKELNVEFDVNDYLNNIYFNLTCKKCGYDFQTNKLTVCPKCNEYHITQPHKKIISFLEEIGIRFEINKRFTIEGKVLELDIYIPAYNLGIEVNGVYWHSDLFRDKEHNLLKKEYFKKIGINVLFFWDVDIVNPMKFDIIKSIIKTKFGTNKLIYARKCEVVELAANDVSDFLDLNHLQGGINSKYNLGLIHKGELVSVMTFGKTRFSKDGTIELYRYANKKGVSVIGGAFKLFKHIPFDYDKIITFADYDFVDKDNNIYLKLGFRYKKIIPYFFYVKGQKRYHRYQLQKHRLKNMDEFKDIYNDKLTADEMLQMKKYLKCYTCGQLKYVYERS